MRRPLTARERRIGAWLLVAAVLALLHGLILQPVFIAPWQEVHQQMRELAERRQHYQRLLDQRDRLRQTMAASPAEQGLDSLLLPGEDASAVVADLMQNVAQQVAGNAQRGAGCQLTQRMPIVPQEQGGQPFRQVRLSLDLDCAIEPLTTLLHQLETGQPWLFVDELKIRKAGNAPAEAGPGRLSVHLLVSGFLAAAPEPSAPQQDSTP